MPGRGKILNGWGVMVRMPGRRPWSFLTRPGSEDPLATSLAGAQAWARDYERRGCKARLVELERGRGRSYREQTPPAPPQQLALL
jgi:hypothetical protein